MNNPLNSIELVHRLDLSKWIGFPLEAEVLQAASLSGLSHLRFLLLQVARGWSAATHSNTSVKIEQSVNHQFQINNSLSKCLLQSQSHRNLCLALSLLRHYGV